MPYKIGHPLQLLQADTQIVTSYRNDAYENKKTWDWKSLDLKFPYKCKLTRWIGSQMLRPLQRATAVERAPPVPSAATRPASAIAAATCLRPPPAPCCPPTANAAPVYPTTTACTRVRAAGPASVTLSAAKVLSVTTRASVPAKTRSTAGSVMSVRRPTSTWRQAAACEWPHWPYSL